MDLLQPAPRVCMPVVLAMRLSTHGFHFCWGLHAGDGEEEVDSVGDGCRCCWQFGLGGMSGARWTLTSGTLTGSCGSLVA